MSIIDPWAEHTSGSTDCCDDAYPAVPSDSTDLPIMGRCLYLLSSGDIRITLKSGRVIDIPGLERGQKLELRAARLHATGTTAHVLVMV